ncbi:MAG TPA: hypothetical protein VMH88_06215 [Gemmatimonadales bacterium]|nr:hypothetical protein [Gemmatimonadales bacterium]
MVRAAVAVMVATVFLVPKVTQAQSNRWEDQVNNLLKTASKTLADKGYKQTHEAKTGSLHNSESESFTLELDGGTDYAIVGVCDNDCDDIDLRLFNDDGDEVDSDTKTDDVPIVVASPRKTSKYRIKVIMASCKTSPCWYGIGVYGK